MKGITISNQIIEVLDYLGEKFGIAIDWSADNVMPYIQTLCEKYIAWEINSSIFWLVVGAILTIVGVLFIMYDWSIGWDIGPTFIGACFLLVGIPMIGTQVLDIIKCNTFPELQIVEYAKSLISTNTN